MFSAALSLIGYIILATSVQKSVGAAYFALFLVVGGNYSLFPLVMLVFVDLIEIHLLIKILGAGLRIRFLQHQNVELEQHSLSQYPIVSPCKCYVVGSQS